MEKQDKIRLAELRKIDKEDLTKEEKAELKQLGRSKKKKK